jgi:hypothetical protein
MNYDLLVDGLSYKQAIGINPIKLKLTSLGSYMVMLSGLTVDKCTQACSKLNFNFAGMETWSRHSFVLFV